MFVVVASAVFILCSGAEMCTPLTSKGSDVVSWIPCYCPPPKKKIFPMFSIMIINQIQKNNGCALIIRGGFQGAVF